jgi:hypothetical protein
MVHAGLGHLRKAFQRQRPPAGAQVQNRNLLLFYAVECGLKAAWLTRNKLRDTSQIEPLFLRDGGHDLTLWTKRLYLPATITSAKPNFRLRDAGTALQLKFAHQAWRYGVDVEPEDEAALHQWLEQVWQWAKGDLRL